MKKKLIVFLAVLFAARFSTFAGSGMFVQGGLGVGSNIASIVDSHEIEFISGHLFLGYKGFHVIAVHDTEDDDGNEVSSKNFERYVPVPFIGFHGDTYYMSFGIEPDRFGWFGYSSDFSIALFSPVINFGWDIPVVNNDRHSLILNIDLTFFYNDLGDQYSFDSNLSFYFIPKLCGGVKYRFKVRD